LKKILNLNIDKPSQPADFFCTRESCSNTKQQQCVLVGTVKRIWWCEPEREHTLKHKEHYTHIFENSFPEISMFNDF
jgi:hypothetical protein